MLWNDPPSGLSHFFVVSFNFGHSFPPLLPRLLLDVKSSSGLGGTSCFALTPAQVKLRPRLLSHLDTPCDSASHNRMLGLLAGRAEPLPGSPGCMYTWAWSAALRCGSLHGPLAAGAGGCVRPCWGLCWGRASAECRGW